MNILFGRWHTTHGGKSDSHQWAADILQTVVKEKPLLRKALTAAFQDDLVKENLLTYVRNINSILYAFNAHPIPRFCTARGPC
jgi:hypothetical protein